MDVTSQGQDDFVARLGRRQQAGFQFGQQSYAPSSAIPQSEDCVCQIEVLGWRTQTRHSNTTSGHRRPGNTTLIYAIATGFERDQAAQLKAAALKATDAAEKARLLTAARHSEERALKYKYRSENLPNILNDHPILPPDVEEHYYQEARAMEHWALDQYKEIQRRYTLNCSHDELLRRLEAYEAKQKKQRGCTGAMWDSFLTSARAFRQRLFQ